MCHRGLTLNRPKASLLLSNLPTACVCHWRHQPVSHSIQKSGNYPEVYSTHDPTIQRPVTLHFCHLIPKYLWSLASILHPWAHYPLSPPIPDLFSTFLCPSLLFKRWCHRLHHLGALATSSLIRKGCSVGGASRRVNTSWREVYVLFVFLLLSPCLSL